MAPGDFMAQVRSVMRLRHLSYCTEQSYCSVIKQFICFHHKRHPSEMGADEVTAMSASQPSTSLFVPCSSCIGSYSSNRYLPR